MTGMFVWFEYVSSDTTKAKGFFGELFGWSTQEVPMPQGTYSMIAAGGATIGGYQPDKGAAHWLTHLRVDDAKAAAAKVTSLGGKVLAEPFKVGEFGTMAVVTDPHGGKLALWQPAKAEDPPAREAGRFCWNELASKDPAASVAFYRAIGGFDVKAMPMPTGDYHVLESGGVPRAGITAPMGGEPHAWLPYVQVTRTDDIVAKAKRLGATIAVPATDIPNVGRFAVIVDAQGVATGILQPPA